MLVDESFFKSLLDFIDFDRIRESRLEYSDIDHARNFAWKKVGFIRKICLGKFALENLFTVKSREVDCLG